jgi:hypothetical protein
MSRTLLQGVTSRIELEYLVGRASVIECLSEVNEIKLFTKWQIKEAFVADGLQVERKPRVLRTRGIHMGTLPQA